MTRFGMVLRRNKKGKVLNSAGYVLLCKTGRKYKTRSIERKEIQKTHFKFELEIST